MNKGLIWVLLGIALVSYGCQSPPPAPPPPDPVVINQDRYRDTITYSSDVMKIGAPGDRVQWILVGRRYLATGRRSFHVQWANIYRANNWRFYQSATNARAQSLRMTQIERDAEACHSGTCLYKEVYDIYFPEQQIREGARNGLSFKVFGQDGSNTVTAVPADLIAALGEAMKLP